MDLKKNNGGAQNKNYPTEEYFMKKKKRFLTVGQNSMANKMIQAKFLHDLHLQI